MCKQAERRKRKHLISVDGEDLLAVKRVIVEEPRFGGRGERDDAATKLLEWTHPVFLRT